MEKRRFARVLFQTEAVLKYQDTIVQGGVENLSLKGMFFKVQQEIPLNEPVEIQIFLSGSSSELTIDVKGKVVRQEEDGLAVLFEDIGLDSFIHLKNVVAYNTGDDAGVMQEFYRFMKHGEAKSG